MSVHNNLIAEAKHRLSLSALMRQLGYGDRAKRSARCPFHEDSSASFSVFTGNEGEERWNCFAGCGQGDAIDFLAKVRQIPVPDAISEFKRLAGIVDLPSSVTNNPVSPLHSQRTFDWSRCIAAFTPDNRARLAEWRGYSPEFVDWLHDQGLVGLFEGECIAFPVHDSEGKTVGCHWRIRGEGSWRFYPAGTRTTPLIIGDIAQARTVFAFESQWDLLAVLNALHWHIQPVDSTAAIATRGASNGRLLAGRCRSDATVYAFTQNDPAGQKWLSAVVAGCGSNCFQVVTPQPQKDVNDWTRAGASRPEIEAAIASAQAIMGSTLADLHASDPQSPFTTVPDEQDNNDARVPFPIECLPPDMARIVHAVALSLRVPDSLPGLMVLALTSASIGKGLVLDWRPGKSPTPANLFVMLSAESGTGKSECYKIIASPLLGFERGMQERWRKEIQPQLQADLRYAEGQLKKLDRKLAKESTPHQEVENCRGQMQFHLARIEELRARLHEPQLSIQDATVEKAAAVMHFNDETSFSTSSDARKLVDNLLGRYSANKNLADDGIYLNAFSGDDVKVDRQGRESVRLANPCLTLFWALQPDALSMLLEEQSLQQGGFLARCLLAHTYAEPQYVGGETQGLPSEACDRFENLIRDLLLTYRQPPTLPSTEVETLNSRL